MHADRQLGQRRRVTPHPIEHRQAFRPIGIAWLGRIATERWIYLAVAGYLGAFVTWMTLLRYAPIGPAFAATHLDIVTVLVVSVMWLGETLSRPQIVGAALILTGITVLAVTKNEEPERRLHHEDAA